MAVIAPAWANPCCCARSARCGIAITTCPGSTRTSRAPSVAMNAWRSKLARTRSSSALIRSSGAAGAALCGRLRFRAAGGPLALHRARLARAGDRRLERLPLGIVELHVRGGEIVLQLLEVPG